MANGHGRGKGRNLDGPRLQAELLHRLAHDVLGASIEDHQLRRDGANDRREAHLISDRHFPGFRLFHSPQFLKNTPHGVGTRGWNAFLAPTRQVRPALLDGVRPGVPDSHWEGTRGDPEASGLSHNKQTTARILVVT